MYKLYVRVFDEGGKRQVVELDDFKRTTGTLEEVKSRKAELEKAFTDRNRWRYEIREGNYKQ